eukprot:Awhi_evm1s13682
MFTLIYRYEDMNSKTTEFLYRRVDIEDIVQAVMLSIEKAPALGFAKYVISAPSPFEKGDCSALKTNPAEVLKRVAPEYATEYERRNWKLLPSFD